MKFKTGLLAVIVVVSLQSASAQHAETKYEKDIFGKFKSKAKVIAQSDTEDLRLEKVCITTSSASVLYTKTGDSTTILSADRFTRRGAWKQDTVRFAGNIARIVPNEKLVVYKLFLKSNRYQYLMFGGQDTIRCSILNDNGVIWSNQKVLSRYHIGKIGGIALDNVTMTTHAFFIGCKASITGGTCCREDNVIMSVSTKDNGENWSNPRYVIKHNEVSFDCISIAELNHKNRRGQELYMILSEAHNSIPYYSKSIDGGTTWSYPKKISRELFGYEHKIVMEKDRIYIAFKRSDANDKPSNLYLWQGNIRDLEKGDKGKLVAKVTDYEALPSLSAKERDSINASTNLDIVGIGKKKLYLTVSAKWNTDKPTSILGILVDLQNINIE